jgi:dimethylhistidine N-methyltransferase
MDSSFESGVARDVRAGLRATPKRLPPYLFYDEAGSRLYERITTLPEYYLTRSERAILKTHASAIVERASSGRELRILELGAGTATKTELLLRATLASQGRCVYVPVDVSSSAIDEALGRLAREMPEVDVVPLVMPYGEALRCLRAGVGASKGEIGRSTSAASGSDLVLFLGSSIGNFEDDEAVALLAGVRDALGPASCVLVGTDLKKAPETLLRAYDDRAGVTAAFNLNLLDRINRELGGTFDRQRFSHVARWNEARSRIEMHLESHGKQAVTIGALGMRVLFEAGETIHTESSVKYELPRVGTLLAAAGFWLEETFYDEGRRFAVHLASAK